MIGAILFIFIVAGVYLGPYLWSIDPTQIDIRSRNQGPQLGASLWHRPVGPRHPCAHDVGWSDIGVSRHHRDAVGAVSGLVHRCSGRVLQTVGWPADALDRSVPGLAPAAACCW